MAILKSQFKIVFTLVVGVVFMTLSNLADAKLRTSKLARVSQHERSDIHSNVAAKLSVHFQSEQNKPAANQVFFSYSDGQLTVPAIKFDQTNDSLLSKAMAIEGFTGNKGEIMSIISPEINSAGRYLLVGLGNKSDINAVHLQSVGSALSGWLLKHKVNAVSAFFPTQGSESDVLEFAYGAVLNAYRFDKYKTSSDIENTRLNVVVSAPLKLSILFKPYRNLVKGIFFARDLVNEPANSIYPQTAVKAFKALSSDKLKIRVLSEAKMKALGMNTILAVGKGSNNKPKLLIMEYQGGKKDDKPYALTGKGITFDSGGISLKSGDMVWLMKGDLGGAAAVMGTMLAVAANRLPVNVVGVVALVENMPDATAQRPGDVIKSMSGKTIEVINTDAEGRLTLADVLWYTQKTFDPKAIFALATMTGAKGQALGKEYAALFSNSDSLATQLTDAGRTSGEKLWRLPVGSGYDKDIESEIADMRNVGAGDAGAIAAAKFIEQFIDNRDWAYLDIADNEFYFDDRPTTPKGGSGYGVKLMYQFLLNCCADTVTNRRTE